MKRLATSDETATGVWTGSGRADDAANCHSRSGEQLAKALGTDTEKGLTWAEVKRREAAQPAEELQVSNVAARVLLNQLKGGVILVLLLATAVTWLLGHHDDSIGIGASVVFSIVCGFLTDYRAEKALAALQSLTAPTARVIREGLEHEVPAWTLQPGDIVVLSAGQVIAADGRLFDVRDLQVDRHGGAALSPTRTALVGAGNERRAQARLRRGLQVG